MPDKYSRVKTVLIDFLLAFVRNLWHQIKMEKNQKDTSVPNPPVLRGFEAYNAQRKVDTAAKIKAVKSIWKEGMSARDIADLLPIKMSRNAVVGLFGRHSAALLPACLNVPNVTLSRIKKQRWINTTLVTTKPTALVCEAVDTGPRHLTLVELEKNCCNFPYGEKNYTFCGQPVAEKGVSYCAHHMQITTRVRSVKQPKTLNPELIRYLNKKAHQQKIRAQYLGKK
jgi:hypothetical protein